MKRFGVAFFGNILRNWQVRKKDSSVGIGLNVWFAFFVCFEALLCTLGTVAEKNICTYTLCWKLAHSKSKERRGYQSGKSVFKWFLDSETWLGRNWSHVNNNSMVTVRASVYLWVAKVVPYLRLTIGSSYNMFQRTWIQVNGAEEIIYTKFFLFFLYRH